MSREQLREVITKPLEKAPAVAYDPGLAQRVLDDACREPENLPLLGFLLKQLWDQRFAGRLRTSTYEAMHGVKGALEKHCDEAWKQCVGENDKAAAARLLRGLVRVLPGSETPLRRRLTREEAGEAGWELARSFAERRLLVLRGGKAEPAAAELAHEALISIWPALREQVQEDGKFLAGRAELDHDRDRWMKEGRSPGLLPGAVYLASVQHWLKEDREGELTEEERDFLARARQRQRVHRARIRAAWTAAAMVFALIVGLGTFLVYQQRVSTQREEWSRSRLLADFSAEVAKQDPGQAALIAMGAYEIAPTDEARNAMLRRYDQFKDAAWVLTGAEGKIKNAVTSVDGAVTLATSDNGRATLFVRQAGGRIQRVQLSLDEMAFVPLVSRDGRRIAYLSATGAVVWHDIDLTAGKPEGLLGPAHPLSGAAFRRMADLAEILHEDVNLMAFSPDAEELATVSGGRLQLWDLATGRHRDVPGHMPSNQDALWFGPDRNTLVVQSRSGTSRSSVTAVEVGSGTVRKLADDVDSGSTYGSSVGLSGDGTVLVICRKVEQGSDTKVYQALRVTDGRVLNSYTYTGPNSDCASIAVDEKGERFAANTFDSWAVVDTRQGRRVQQTETRAPERTVGRLLRYGRQPLVLTLDQDKNTLTALPLTPSDVGGMDVVVNSPRLVDGGKTMVARVKPWDEPTSDETLALVDAASGRITSEVKRPDSPLAPAPTAAESLAVDEAGTLVADVVGNNKILIRQIPSLHKVAEITTLTPPVDNSGNAEPLTLTFLPGGDELLTLSGSRIEHWNARTGRRLSPPIDARTLKLGKKTPPRFGSTKEATDSGFAVNSSPEAGHVQVMIYGDSVLHSVNLRTGKENKALRVRLGPDVERAFLDSSGRYAAAKTPGGMLELWSTETGRQPARMVGPLGPLGANRSFTGEGFTFSFTGNNGEFYVAKGSSVRFQQTSDPNHFEIYDFTANQYFVAATKDGKTLLRSLSEGSFGNDGRGRLDLIRLDPDLWKRHLCDAVGRDLTQDERRGLPAGLPKVICPA
jgi:WD40 repeat protein